MFGKDKVKGHNRIIKGKSGFKVTRIGDFLRKKDDSKKRNLAIGTAAVIGAGGIALLLRKKEVKISSIKNGLKSATNNTPKYPKGATIKPKDMVVKSFDKLPDPWQGTYAPSPDPWKTPIMTKLDDVSEMVVKPKVKNTPLLTGKKVPDSRGNLYGYDNRISRRVAKRAASDANRIVEMEKTYKSISPDNLAMKASIKIDHYLKRPRKTSNLGAPPKPTSLEEVIKNPNIKQAQKKVEDRLSRAERRLNKKYKDLKKNNLTT